MRRRPLWIAAADASLCGVESEDFRHAADATPEDVVAEQPRTMDGLRRPRRSLLGRWPKSSIQGHVVPGRKPSPFVDRETTQKPFDARMF
jgi:hypothetical protein